MDPISISAIVISIITAIGAIIAKLKCKHCHCACIDSDCMNTPPNTPLNTPQTTPNPSYIDELTYTYNEDSITL